MRPRSLARLIAVAAALAPVAAPAPARAQARAAEARVLFVREAGAPAVAAPRGAAEPERVAEERGPAAVAEDARAALAEARGRFLAFRFDEAALGLRAAIARLAPDLARAGASLVVQLELWSGGCDFHAGRRDAARQAFERALALDPAARLPEATFHPDAEAFFAEVVREAATYGPTSVTIRSTPTDARIAVDGRDAGRTPATLVLRRGAHYVDVERVGYARRWVVLRAEGSGLQTHDVVLQRATGAALRAQLGRAGGLAEVPDEATLAAIAREYGVDAVVVARRDGSLLRHPPLAAAAPSPWPWVAVGVGVAAIAAVVTVVQLTLDPMANLVGPR